MDETNYCFYLLQVPTDAHCFDRVSSAMPCTTVVVLYLSSCIGLLKLSKLLVDRMSGWQLAYSGLRLRLTEANG